MRSLHLLAMLILTVAGNGWAGDGNNEVIFCTLENEADLKMWEGGDSGQVKVTIDHQDKTDRNLALRVESLGGQYPGISTYKMPKDWSKHEVLSFEVWSNSKYGLAIRIDDANSKDFKTRWGTGFTLEKGRNLIQIPTKEVAKVLDLTKIKALIIFTVDSPKGFTLYYDNFRLGPQLTDKVEFIPYAQRIELVPNTVVESAHFPVAKPTAGGPVNVLAVYAIEEGRDMSELMERVDLKVSPVTIGRGDGIHKWIGLKYGQRSYPLAQRYLASSAQGPEKFETMVLGMPTGWIGFGKGATDAIYDRVKNRGEGVVFCFPFPGGAQRQPWPDDLKELSPLINSETEYPRENGDEMHYANSGRHPSKKWKIVKEHPITRGMQAALEALPYDAIHIQDYEVGPGSEVLIETEDGHPILAVKTVGKGRTVAFAWRSHSLAPHIAAPNGKRDWREYRYWEVFYDLMARATLWSAGRDMATEGAAVAMTQPKFPDPNFSLKQWKNARGEVTAWELGFTAPTDAPLTVTVPEFQKMGAAEIPVQFDAFELPAPDAAFETVVRLVDRQGNRRRTMVEKHLTAADLKAAQATADGKPVFKTTLATARLKSLGLYVEVEALQGGKRVMFGETVTFFTPSSEWKDYEVYGWGTSGISYLRDLQMEQLRNFGLSTEQVGPHEARASFLRGFRIQTMMGNTGMHDRRFDEKYRDFMRTGDQKLLIREPSYADPAFLADLKRRQQTWLKLLVPFAPLTVSVGDETSLTSYGSAFDFDFHPENVKNFRAALKQRFVTVAALNTALGETFESFEAIQPPVTAASKKSGKWGLWTLWRDHNDQLWAGAFQFFTDSLKEVYPDTRLSVSGTQTYAPFNGVDWARLSPALGAVADYTGRFQLCKRLSFNPNLRSTPWCGYGREGRATDFQLWTNLTFDGDGAAYFWYPSLLNPDYDQSESAKAYFRSQKQLRAGIGMQYQRTRRQWSPVALLWSPGSQRVAWMLDKQDEFIKAERDCYSRLVDAGYDPFFITEEAVAAGALKTKGVKALVLPMTLAIGRGGPGSKDVAGALKKFTADGGTVYATHPAQYDEFLKGLADADEAAAYTPFPADAEALQKALETAGVKPYALLRTAAGARLPNVSAALAALTNDAGKKTGGYILTVLRAPVGEKEVVGGDGVVYMEKEEGGGAPIEKMTIDIGALGQTFQVFDLRSRHPVVVTDGKFTLDMQEGDGRPFALVPYAAVKLNATVSRSPETLGVTLAVQTPAGQAVTQPHAVRMDVKDLGTGQIDGILSQNLWIGDDGKLQIDTPLAVEDRNRKLQVTFTDMLTGGTQTVTP